MFGAKYRSEVSTNIVGVSIISQYYLERRLLMESPGASNKTGLLKMKDLAQKSGVPASTIKHYLREGLLPEPSLRTSKNMAYYDEAIIPRIKLIKELQKTRFLPLQTIRELLDRAGNLEHDDHLLSGLRVAIHDISSNQGTATKSELIEGGMTDEEFDWLKKRKLLRPKISDSGEEVYSGDDLALCQVLCRARQSGLRADMLPHTIIQSYCDGLTGLIESELQLFRAGVVSRGDEDMQPLIRAATALSESLILVLRRKLMVPVLSSLTDPNNTKADIGE